MINRDEIIKKLKEKLEPLDYIYALWLEGADACNTTDEYSDIDIWVDFEDANERQTYDAVESALTELSGIDYTYDMSHSHPKIRQRIYHLSDSSEYLMIDFCLQLHSRPKSEFEYIHGSMIETAKVIFDKANIIRYVEYDPAKYEDVNKKRLSECKYRYSQLMRVRKYVLRKQYLEAYAYYNRYVLEPLIDLLRIVYTPANTDYYLIHISHHIPDDDLKKLEYFAQLTSVEDIAERIPKAEKWFDELFKKSEINTLNFRS